MNEKIAIRELKTEDRSALWAWRNDTITNWHFNTNPSITFDEHNTWFKNILANDHTIILVCLISNLRMGCVWFELQNKETYRVFIYIKPLYCGKDYSAKMLKNAIHQLISTHTVKTITTRIRKSNKHARRLPKT